MYLIPPFGSRSGSSASTKLCADTTQRRRLIVGDQSNFFFCDHLTTLATPVRLLVGRESCWQSLFCSSACSHSHFVASLLLQGSLGTLASHTSCNSLSQRTKSKRKVSLHNDVAVIPIPSHNEYLHRERLWCSASELYHNAARNTIEFAAEGFNWRNVADDDQMIEAPSGERIHPIHFMNIANFRSSAINNQQDHDDRRN